MPDRCRHGEDEARVHGTGQGVPRLHPERSPDRLAAGLRAPREPRALADEPAQPGTGARPRGRALARPLGQAAAMDRGGPRGARCADVARRASPPARLLERPQIGLCSCVGTNGPRGGPSRPVRVHSAAVSLSYPVTAVGLTGHRAAQASAPRKSSGAAKVPPNCPRGHPPNGRPAHPRDLGRQLPPHQQ